MPSRFRQVNEVCLRRRKSRYTPGAKTAGPSPEKETPAAHGSCLRPTKKTPAALNVLRRAILLPRAVEPMAPRLHPTFSGVPPMADFRPGGLAASVHPCAHSAVRVGLLTPFLSGCRLTPTGAFAADSHTASSDTIHFPAPCPHRAILIIHDSPGKVNGPPHAKRLCIAGLQKPPQRRGVPLFCRKKDV